MTDDELLFSVLQSVFLALSMQGQAQAQTMESDVVCTDYPDKVVCTVTAYKPVQPVQSLPIPLDTLTDDNRLQCTGDGQDWEYTYRRILSDGSTGVVDYTGLMGITCISAILPQSHSLYGVVWWMHNETHTTDIYRVYLNGTN